MSNYDAELEMWEAAAAQDSSPAVPTRYAAVKCFESDRARLERYMPSNYGISDSLSTPSTAVIVGSDNHGWTLEGYVIPRLASGLIFAREISAEAATTDPDEVW